LIQYLDPSNFDENRVVVYMALDVLNLHFDEDTQKQLLSVNDIVQLFKQEGIIDRIGVITVKLTESLAGPARFQDENYELKYLDKVFNLIHILHGTSSLDKITFSREK